MREILFRGKTLLGKWIEGDLLQYLGCGKVYIAQNYKGAGGQEVISETVGQYTGLTDKNGKKIFGGDILEITSEYYSRKEKSLYQVRYHEATASWCAFAIGFLQRVPLCRNECKYYEIIGNIHDNPELLKGSASDA